MLQNAGKGAIGLFGFTRRQQALAFFQHGGRIRGLILGCWRFGTDRQLLQKLVQRLRQLRFGARICQIGDRLALENSIDGGDRADLKLRRDEVVGVHIHLDQLDTAVGVIRRHFLQHRAKLFAGAAPFGPEIQNDEAGHRRIDHVGTELIDRFLLFGGQRCGRHGF